MAPKRTPKPPQLKGEGVYRADSWLNTMTGINVAGFDKRRAATFQSKRLTEFEAEDIWRGDDIVERAIETVPMVMLRNGFDVIISDPATAEKPLPPPKDDGDPFAPSRMDKRAAAKRQKKLAKVRRDSIDASDTRREIGKKLQGLKVVNRYIDAMMAARAYGGAALWIGADEVGRQWKDRDRQSKPLNPNMLKDIRHLIVLRPHECWATRWYRDELEPNYGTPSHYFVQRDTMGAGGSAPIIVHESRLIRFYGAVTSRRQMATNNGWGDSIILRFLEIVADFQATYQGAAHLVTDFAQAVQKIEGLAELVAAGDDAAVIRRAEMVTQSRSIARTVLIDSKEEYTREQTPLTGLPDLMDRFAKRVAAAVHMPVTLLFGDSPAGLNASGENDVRWFYDEVANLRELHLREKLEHLIRLLFLCTEGPTAGEEPAGWKVNFHPLWQATQKELAERNYAQAQADCLYVTNQVLTPEEVAESRFGGDDWSNDTKLDEELRDQMEEAHKKVVDDAIAEGNVPQPSPVKAAGQQGALDLAKAQPDPEPGEKDPKAKAKQKAA